MQLDLQGRRIHKLRDTAIENPGTIFGVHFISTLMQRPKSKLKSRFRTRKCRIRACFARAAATKRPEVAW